MNLWLRLLWLVLTLRLRGKLPMPFEKAVLWLRVLPNDLDVNFHMNNGRYLTIMDLGRLDMFARVGLWKAVRDNGWTPMLSTAKIHFRRELRLWQKYRLETRIPYWDDKIFVMEHRIMVKNRKGGGETAVAIGLMRGGMYDRAKRSYVPVSKLFEVLRANVPPPPLSEEIRAFLASEEALKRAS